MAHGMDSMASAYQLTNISGRLGLEPDMRGLHEGTTSHDLFRFRREVWRVVLLAGLLLPVLSVSKLAKLHLPPF